MATIEAMGRAALVVVALVAAGCTAATPMLGDMTTGTGDAGTSTVASSSSGMAAVASSSSSSSGEADSGTGGHDGTGGSATTSSSSTASSSSSSGNADAGQPYCLPNLCQPNADCTVPQCMPDMNGGTCSNTALAAAPEGTACSVSGGVVCDGTAGAAAACKPWVPVRCRTSSTQSWEGCLGPGLNSAQYTIFWPEPNPANACGPTTSGHGVCIAGEACDVAFVNGPPLHGFCE